MKILEYFKNQKDDKNFNLLPDAVFTIEQDGKIINVNDRVLEIFTDKQMTTRLLCHINCIHRLLFLEEKAGI